MIKDLSVQIRAQEDEEKVEIKQTAKKLSLQNEQKSKEELNKDD